VKLYLHSPYTSSWHGAELKHRDFTFALHTGGRNLRVTGSSQGTRPCKAAPSVHATDSTTRYFLITLEDHFSLFVQRTPFGSGRTRPFCNSPWAIRVEIHYGAASRDSQRLSDKLPRTTSRLWQTSATTRFSGGNDLFTFDIQLLER